MKMISESLKEATVGRFHADLDLANDADLVMVEKGLLKPEQVRRMRITGVVDTGATSMVIPEAVAKQLGLESLGATAVRYADGRRMLRQVVERLRVTCEGRNSVFNAIVEPDRTSALIGAVVLETLDFIVDPRLGRVVPRDPAGTISEIE